MYIPASISNELIESDRVWKLSARMAILPEKKNKIIFIRNKITFPAIPKIPAFTVSSLYLIYLLKNKIVVKALLEKILYKFISPVLIPFFHPVYNLLQSLLLIVIL